jgi:Spy/CpxP family protein refolding chaperone
MSACYTQVLMLDQSHFEEEPLMTKNQFAKSLTIAAGLILLFATPAPARAGAPQSAMQVPTPASPGPLQKSDSLPDFFAGLNYTDDQKAEIAQIRHDMDTRRGAVAKDDRLTQDQKDAMILGYTHLENGEIFKVLTPEQRRQVRQRLQARGATDQAAQKKHPTAN